MNIETVVENQSNYNIVWHEPCNGLDQDGNSIIVHSRISVSVEGALAMQREIYKKKNPKLLSELSTLDQLCDFIAVNWAVVELKK